MSAEDTKPTPKTRPRTSPDQALAGCLAALAPLKSKQRARVLSAIEAYFNTGRSTGRPVKMVRGTADA